MSFHYRILAIVLALSGLQGPHADAQILPVEDFSAENLLNSVRIPLEDLPESKTYVLLDSVQLAWYDSLTSGWHSTDRQYYTYNDEGLPINRLTKRYQITNGRWREYEYITATYNSRSLPNMLLYQYRASGAPQWIDARRVLLYYNLENAPESIISQNYSQDRGWQLDTRIAYEYDEAGYRSLRFEERYSAPGIWTPVERTFYTYTPQGDIEVVLEEIWNEALGKWHPAERMVYEYTGEDVSSISEETWSSGDQKWTTTSVEKFLYGESGQVAQISNEISQHQASGGTVWVPEFRSSLSYNDYGKVMEDVLQLYQPDLAYWKNYRRELSYWSVKTVAQNFIVSDKFPCTFANPVAAGDLFYCEGLDPERNYQINLLAPHGSLVMSQRISGNQYPTVPAGLSPGIYLLEVTAGNYRRVTKIIYSEP